MLIDRGDTVVLVGTPNPDRVHQLHDYVGTSGRVLILEPVPENYKQLIEGANRYSNVTIDSRAAGSKVENKIMPVADVGNDQICPTDSPIAGQETIEIKFDLIDNILSEYNICPDFIEVMVNGNEGEVLKGMSDTLRKRNARLLIKSFGYNTNVREDDNQVYQILQKADYRLIRSPARDSPPSPGSPDGDILALP